MVILQAVSRTFNGVDLQANVDNSMPTLFEFAEQQHLHSKQLIAFQVIYSSFMLSILQFFMCLTGIDGTGKTYIIKFCHEYCKIFCNATDKIFKGYLFPYPALTQS